MATLETEAEEEREIPAAAVSLRQWLYQRCSQAAVWSGSLNAMDLAMAAYRAIETARVSLDNDSFNVSNMQMVVMAEMRKVFRSAQMDTDFVMDLAARMEDMADDEALTLSSLLNFGV